jgi:hypothetical protein
MHRNSTVVAQHLASNIFTNWRSSVQLEEHVCLQEVLGSLHFGIGDVRAESHPLVLEINGEVIDGHGVTDKVNTPQSSVLVASVEGLEGMSESVLATSFSQIGSTGTSTNLKCVVKKFFEIFDFF